MAVRELGIEIVMGCLGCGVLPRCALGCLSFERVSNFVWDSCGLADKTPQGASDIAGQVLCLAYHPVVSSFANSALGRFQKPTCSKE